MQRQIDVVLLAVKPGWNRGTSREWTATFRLDWGEERHMLAIAVVAANGAEAESAARQAMAVHLASLAGKVAVTVAPEPRRLMTARAAAVAAAPGAPTAAVIPRQDGRLRIA